MMCGMKWIPPLSLADRVAWSKEHPWIAGCYLGLVLSVLLTAWGMIRTHASIWFALAVAVPTWVLAWVLFPVLTKRRFGERANAERYPAPTYRRLWSRASDRFLSLFLVLGIAGGFISISDIVTRPRDVLGAVLTLAVSAFWVSTTWAERRRRRVR